MSTGLVMVTDRCRHACVRAQVEGSEVDFRASREVLPCGGAFNSPQLLELSGQCRRLRAGERVCPFPVH